MIYRNTTFGEALRRWRESQEPKVTLEAVAEAVNEMHWKKNNDPIMRASFIALLERSEKKSPSLTTVLKICNAIGVPFDSLMGVSK